MSKLLYKNAAIYYDITLTCRYNRNIFGEYEHIPYVHIYKCDLRV